MSNSIDTTDTDINGGAHASLARTLTRRQVSMISLASIIGAGLFVGSSAAIHTAGPATIFSYLLGGALNILVMRMLAEMLSGRQGLRSFTDFARAGLGPGAAFVCGWLYWYFWVMVLPVEAIAGAGLLQTWIALPTWLIGLVLISAMTIVNLMSASSFAQFEFWFASLHGAHPGARQPVSLQRSVGYCRRGAL